MPLAFSARCFTARHLKLSKDDCGFRCIEDPDGLLLSTTEGRPFLTLNGIQTQSAARHCLIGEAAALRRAGVSSVRLSPVSQGFAEAIARFDVFNHRGDAFAARAAFETDGLTGGLVDGCAHRRPAIDGIQAP